MRDIERMKEHVIICGVGRTGRQVAQELDAAGQEYLVIERDPGRIEQLREYVPGARVVEGDATHDQVLLDAGLVRAKGLVACLSSDTDNLFVCLSARDLAAKPTIVARAYEEESMDKLYRAGADHVVSPNISSAIRMASMVLHPSVVTLFDIATRSSRLALRIEQTTIPESSLLAGRTLAEAQIPQETGLIVIAIGKPTDGQPEFLFNPSADARMEAGDEVIVLGSDEQIQKLRGYLGGAA